MTQRVVMVEWLDSYGCSTNWTELDGIQPQSMMCRSVGWLVYEDDRNLVIVPHVTSRDHAHAEQQGCGDMTIPRPAVVSVVDMQEVT